MKKLLSLSLVITVIFSVIVGTSYAGASASDTEQYTLAEVQDVLLTYLEDQGITISPGTKEFYDFSVEQLGFTDSPIISGCPHYSDVRLYLAAYIRLVDRNSFEFGPIVNSTPQSEINEIYVESDAFLSKNIADLTSEGTSWVNSVELLEQQPSLLAAYSGTKAVNYAHTYSTIGNFAYPIFSSDCTNYVSQCVLNGGKSLVLSSARYVVKDTTDYWYMVVPNPQNTSLASYTTSWALTDDFYTFWKTHGATCTVTSNKSYIISNAQPGDVVQLADANGVPWHTIIITGRTSGDVLFCGHTTNRNDASFNDIVVADKFILFKY